MKPANGIASAIGTAIAISLYFHTLSSTLGTATSTNRTNVDDSSPASLHLLQSAAGLGLTAPTLLMAAAAAIGLIDALWPQRGAPDPTY